MKDRKPPKGKGKVPRGNRPPAPGQRTPHNRAGRRRLRAIEGGRAGEPDPPKRQPENQPAGRLYNALDRLVRDRALNDAQLDEPAVTVALMQFTAHVCARFSYKFQGAIDVEEFADTMKRLFSEELAAAEKDLAPKPPGSAG